MQPGLVGDVPAMVGGEGEGGWNYTIFKVASDPNNFVIQEFYDSMINLGYVDFGLFRFLNQNVMRYQTKCFTEV